MPKKKKKKSWIKPKIDDKPCASCGEMINMNGDGWVVNGNSQIVHYGSFNEFQDKCFKKLIE
jgi:hypothetical protein